VGDTLTFNDRAFEVGDVRSIGNVLVTQFAFVSAQDYREIFAVPDSVNYFLVLLDPGVPPVQVLEALAGKIDGSSVFTTDEFAGRASQKGTGDFLPIIRVILVISFIVGLSILSLVIYSATIERAREYAIMKVIGASPLGLYRIVLSQSIFIAVVGLGVLGSPSSTRSRVISSRSSSPIRARDIALSSHHHVMSVIASYPPINASPA
jgi:putative ABC transport system permease protein